MRGMQQDIHRAVRGAVVPLGLVAAVVREVAAIQQPGGSGALGLPSAGLPDGQLCQSQPVQHSLGHAPPQNPVEMVRFLLVLASSIPKKLIIRNVCGLDPMGRGGRGGGR